MQYGTHARHQGVPHTESIQPHNAALSSGHYVVLNPVRTGMALTAQAYGWSSYGATAGDGESPTLLGTGWLLMQFGLDCAATQQPIVALSPKALHIRLRVRNSTGKPAGTPHLR
jgi:hypothetical protein